MKRNRIEISELKKNKIVIKGKDLDIQWVDIPTIDKHCILIWSKRRLE